MCMSAIVWAGTGGMLYGSSITALEKARIAQITIAASVVRDASPFYRGRIVGGVLRAETDALFRSRQRGRGLVQAARARHDEDREERQTSDLRPSPNGYRRSEEKMA
jgi:hypothetical protein